MNDMSKGSGGTRATNSSTAHGSGNGKSSNTVIYSSVARQAIKRYENVYGAKTSSYMPEKWGNQRVILQFPNADAYNESKKEIKSEGKLDVALYDSIQKAIVIRNIKK